MKISKMLNESFECVKINGILRNLTNDEMKIYKRVKNEGKLFKADLTEFEANVATSMVTKGLLRRKKAQQENGKHGRIYYVARGRNGHLKTKPLEEVAPPDKKIESWIKKNKKRFKDRYGDSYEKYLYGRAWKAYNGKLTESANDTNDFSVSIYTENDGSYNGDEIVKAKELITEMLEYMNGEIVEAESSGIADYQRDSARRKAYIRIFHKLNEKGFMNDYEPALFVSKNFTINDREDLYDDYLQPFRDRVYEDAVESGEYDQFGEREYNSDATWEAIYDYGDITLIDEYCDFSDFQDFADDVIDNLNKVIDVIENPQINFIPWSGEDDEEFNPQQIKDINKQKTSEIIRSLKEKFSNVYEIKNLLESLYEAREYPNRSQLSDIESLCEYYAFYHNKFPVQEFDSIISSEDVKQITINLQDLENRWDRYRDRARDAAIDSGDFAQYDDAEYDGEATREEVDNRSFDELISNLSYFESYYKEALEIRKIFEKILDACEHINNSSVSTGEEFDESVSYKF